MKIYDIYDEEISLSVGTLLYYEKERKFIIELPDYLNEWNCPLLFMEKVRNKNFTVLNELSYTWVRERIIPNTRQNIGDILKRYKKEKYDEMFFLEKSGGRCSQDNIVINKLDYMPDYVLERITTNIAECNIIDDNILLCIFNNGKIKKVNLSKIGDVPDVGKVLKNKELFESLKIGTGGYLILFNDSIEVSSKTLYKYGEDVQLTRNELLAFINNNILDTSEGCKLLECSRQNLSYLVKESRLNPLKQNVKGNLYLRGDVIRNKW